MKVYLIEEDKIRAIRGSNTSCPLANALNRVLSPGLLGSVGVWNFSVRKIRTLDRVFSGIIPLLTSKWIKSWDRGRPDPIENIYLEIPDELVREGFRQ